MLTLTKLSSKARPAMLALGLGTAALATPVLAQAAALAPMASPAHSLITKVGYDIYVPTCQVIVVGYDMFGRPIFERVCG
jgi:hypothetical protein